MSEKHIGEGQKISFLDISNHTGSFPGKKIRKSENRSNMMFPLRSNKNMKMEMFQNINLINLLMSIHVIYSIQNRFYIIPSDSIKIRAIIGVCS